MDAGSSDVLNILVIDDDEDMRQFITEILLPGGHQAMAVGTAEEGLELLPYTTFQIALLDQNLPGMEGIILGEYLRKNNPHMKIALVTGSDEQKLDRLAEAHDIRVIRKPFQVKEILDIVTAYREEAEARRTERRERSAPDYHVPLGGFFEELSDSFNIPNVPKRVEERLLSTIQRSLTELRSVSRYNERARALAYAGLVAMQVLALKIPKGRDGMTLAEEYDALMREHGRKPELGTAGDAEA